MLGFHFDWLPMLIGVVLSHFIGWFWYSQIGFGKQWMKAQPHRDKSDFQSVYLSLILVHVVFLALLSTLIGQVLYSGLPSIKTALLIIAVWGFSYFSHGLFLGQSKQLMTIDVGYRIVCICVMIAVYSIF